MQKTSNFSLNQWEATDPIRREDFNVDNAVIDAALMALNTATPKITIGTYVGTDTAGKDNPQTLTFDFAPKALLVWGNAYVAHGIRDQKMHMISSGNDVQCPATWSGNTVQWYAMYPAYQMNYNGATYCYLAIG